MSQCAEIKEDGERCGSRNNLRETPKGPRCLWHDPAREEKAREARTKGGNATRERMRREPVQAPPPPQTMEDARVYASWCVEAVASGKLDARTGDVVQKILREFRSATEKAHLEAEVKALRAEIRKGGH